MMIPTEKHGWWSQLRHSGLLISPVMLEEVFPEGLVIPNDFARQYLRENYNRFAALTADNSGQTSSLEPILNLLDYIFNNFLKMEGKWLKSNQLDNSFVVSTIFNENIKPHRIFYTKHSLETPFLAVFAENNKRVGIGKSRKTYGQILRYLRTKNIKLAIQSNGAQIRLIYAGIDNESWVEWETAEWFESAEHLQKLCGFYTLLGKTGLDSRNGYTIPLISAIDGSRNKQSELSSVLGEQIRQAIELLVDDFSSSREKSPSIMLTIKSHPGGTEISDEDAQNAVLQASVRIIMRIVVILFAEARDLLPRSSEKYHLHYGIEGMFEILRTARSREPEEFLEEQQSEWIKLLGLFRLIWFGSSHPDLQIPKYGGQLFAPGNRESEDAVSRALAVFESPLMEVSNSTLLGVLDKLKYGKLKIKQGRTTSFIKGPVDFSELRTEYIGIIYEGILDYMLRSANETMVLLNIGLQPILPLSVLETLNKKDLKDLFDKFSKAESSSDAGDTEEPVEEEPAPPEELEMEDESEEVVEDDEEAPPVTDDSRIMEWAKRTVIETGLVKKTKKNSDDFLFNKAVQTKAKSLIKKVYNKGDLYLSLWGGTRKGTGTFYTKPQLAVPTVRRTLEPLVYELSEEGEKIPKLPEVILSVKVCDPGCGSASFLVAATHYLTDVLYDSLVYHARLLDPDDYKRKTLPYGLKVDSPRDSDLLPCSPDDDKFEERVKARLRRRVVEFCIYGVELNPMAVELARLSLWVETMDKNLPFEFLDHKIKTGNSLAGAWLDTFREYPLAAWLREGGDKSHPSAVNEVPGERTREIKRVLKEKVKKELAELILRRAGEQRLSFIPEPEDAARTHTALFLAYKDMHDQAGSMFGAEQREKIYIDKILNSAEYRQLKEAMDLWCSIWFWEPDKIELAPTPSNFYSPSEETLAIAGEIASKYRFFHWEIEFPDVFNRHRQGFDAIIGNPPWEASKPNSKEYFSRLDPVYRNYGKQEAINQQRKYFTKNPQIESEWLSYLGSFKALSNFFSKAFSPFGDPMYSDDSISLGTGKQYSGLHNLWRDQRKKNKGYSNPRHPFSYQGSADLNLYKLFLEQSHYLIKEFGRLGMIVPSGIYSDNGTKSLRELFIDQSEWEWLFVFENKLKIFDIHRSSKFNPVIVQKGGITKSIKTAFMRTDLAEWETAINVMEYSKDLIRKLSPNNLSLLELDDEKDSEIIEKIYSNAILFSDEGPGSWNLECSTEFHMTNDSHLYSNRNKLLEQGFKQDLYGRMISPGGDIYLPLYQGVMMWQFDFSSKGYLKGAGNRAKWREMDLDNKTIEPQFYLEAIDYSHNNFAPKIVYRSITGTTNQRTCVASLIPDYPCGHNLGVFRHPKLQITTLGYFITILNSLCFDYVIRKKMIGANLGIFIINETPVIKKNAVSENSIKTLGGWAVSLALPGFINSQFWLKISFEKGISNLNLKSLWALTPHERLRLRCILDAAVAELYGISYEDFEWILKDDPTDPKGFWRVDENKPKELRHTTLALEAFKHLKEVGIDKFIEEDWQFRPEIQEQLGPRFYDWQLEGTPEESWAECEFHAKQFLGEENYKKFISNLENPKTSPSITEKHPSKDDDSKDEWKLF